MTAEFDDRTPEQRAADGIAAEPGLTARQKLSMAVAFVLTVALVVFIFANTASTEINYVFGDANTPLWIALLASAVAGALLWPLLRALVRGMRSA